MADQNIIDGQFAEVGEEERPSGPHSTALAKASDLTLALIAHCAIAREEMSPEERERRRHTLGSSEIAAVCDVNPYASVHDVWLSKCRGVDFEGNERTRLGKVLEPAILAMYADRYGVDIVKGEYTIGPEPWMSATPDARRLTGGLAEAKLVGLRELWMWGAGNSDEQESDAVPLHYLAQAQWQLAVTGEPFCDVTALLGTELRNYRIRPREDVQRGLMARGRAFWERYVLTGTPPPVDASDGARSMLKALYPRSDAEALEPSPELEALAKALLEAREQAKEAAATKQLRENQFKDRLKDARGARGKNWRVRYATTKAKTRPFVFEHDDEKGT